LKEKSYDKIRVVQATPYYPPHVGGIENLVRDLSHYLRERS
jgi:hypothetical protein